MGPQLRLGRWLIAVTCGGAFVLACHAPAAAASLVSYTRVSVASNGSEANGSSANPAISGDGRFVAFQSDANNLAPGDSNGVTDVFVHDRVTGITTLESVSTARVQGNAASAYPLLSADGRYVTFLSTATNLVPGVAKRQVYFRDRLMGITTVASVLPNGLAASVDVRSYSLSPEARFVSFDLSYTIDPPTRGCPGIYTHDMSTGSTNREDLRPDGTEPTDYCSFSPSLSADGAYLAFYSSSAELVPGRQVSDGLYVRDRRTGRLTFESVGPNGGSIGTGRSAAISGDGRFVTFSGEIFFIGAAGVYMRDRQSGETVEVVPVSIDSGQVRSLDISLDGRFVSYTHLQRYGYVAEVYDRLDRSLTVNAVSQVVAPVTPVAGGVVAFVSNAALVGDDTNGVADVYLAPMPVGGGPGTPGTPTNLTSTIRGSTFTLTWTPATAVNPATEYVVEAGTVPNGADIGYVATGSTATTFSAPLTGVGNLYLRVRASNAAGVSQRSNETVILATTLPGAAVLTGSVTGNSVSLTWSQPSGPVTTYVIEAGSAPGRADTANFNTNSTATSFAAASVSPGTYFVRVRAVSLAGVGPPSNEVTLVVTGGCPTPAAPGDLTRSVIGTAVTLAWTAAAGATSYVLEVGLTTGASDVLVTDLNSPATSVTRTGVAAGTYFVRVRSKNGCGQSPPSNEAVAIVPSR